MRGLNWRLAWPPPRRGCFPLAASVTCGRSAAARMEGRLGRRWTRTSRPRIYTSCANGFAADADGNLYVTGQSDRLVNKSELSTGLPERARTEARHGARWMTF